MSCRPMAVGASSDERIRKPAGFGIGEGGLWVGRNWRAIAELVARCDHLSVL